jgi:ribosomal protein S27AE
MQPVSEHLASKVHKRNLRLVFLLLGWCVLVVLDGIFAIAKYEWVGLPVFLGFVTAFGYLLFFSWPRCPRCRTVIYAQTANSFRPYPRWVPTFIARLLPKHEFCQRCGLSFNVPLAESEANAL